MRRNKNLDPVLWAPFYVAGLVVANLSGKSERKRCTPRAVVLLAQNMVHMYVYPADVTHFWVDRILTKPLSDVTFLQDTGMVRQNT